MIRFLFLATILLLPFQFALNIGEDIDLVTTRVLVPLLFFLWLVRGLARRKIFVFNGAETWLIISLIFLTAVSLWAGMDWEKGARKFLYLLTLIPLYFLARDLFRDGKFQLSAIRAVWISGTLAAAAAIVQFFLPFFIGLEKTLQIWRNTAPFFLGKSFGRLVSSNPSWLVNVSGETWMRAFGFFPDPHVFSFFASLCFFSGLGYFVWERKMKWKIAAAIGLMLMLFSLGLTFSRGAYLGILMGILFFLLILLFRAGKSGRLALIVTIGLLTATIFIFQPIQKRMASVFSLREGSNIERIENWRQAAGIVADYPLAGIGLGNYSSFIDPEAEERSSIYAHNIFLDLSAETGILGGILFLLLIGAGIWRNILSRNVLGLGLASALVYFLVHGVFDTPIWSPQVFVVFLTILALGAGKNSFQYEANAKQN